MIYILKQIDGAELYKVGSTNDVTKRAKQLSREYQKSLSLVCSFPGGVQEEKALHTLLTAHRDVGEWYVKNAVLDNFISMYANKAPVIFHAFERANPTSFEDALVARDILVDAMKLLGSFEQTKAYSLALVYESLRESNKKWSQRRVRAIYNGEANRIDFYEIRDLMFAADYTHAQAMEKISGWLSRPATSQAMQ